MAFWRAGKLGHLANGVEVQQAVFDQHVLLISRLDIKNNFCSSTHIVCRILNKRRRGPLTDIVPCHGHDAQKKGSRSGDQQTCQKSGRQQTRQKTGDQTPGQTMRKHSGDHVQLDAVSIIR